MKKYSSFGELLIDYRIYSNESQAEFASQIDVDIRTIQRWESDTTLVKQEKEADIVDVTLFPYQLIRNLNAITPIPTYYDFRINKYALTKLDNKLPEASWFKEQMENKTQRIRQFDFDKDFDYILKYMHFHKKCPKNITRVIDESTKILPEMNLIITDESGFYSGHSLVFPINHKTYKNLKTKRISESEITVSDLSKYQTQDQIIFYGYDITADCNNNMFYLVNQLLRFLRDLSNQNYLYCSTGLRYDTYKLVHNLGLKIIWEDEKEKNNLGLESSLRFQEGDFRDFLERT